jgi:hypothetical protein
MWGFPHTPRPFGVYLIPREASDQVNVKKVKLNFFQENFDG